MMISPIIVERRCPAWNFLAMFGELWEKRVEWVPLQRQLNERLVCYPTWTPQASGRPEDGAEGRSSRRTRQAPSAAALRASVTHIRHEKLKSHWNWSRVFSSALRHASEWNRLSKKKNKCIVQSLLSKLLIDLNASLHVILRKGPDLSGINDIGIMIKNYEPNFFFKKKKGNIHEWIIHNTIKTTQ